MSERDDSGGSQNSSSGFNQFTGTPDEPKQAETTRAFEVFTDEAKSKVDSLPPSVSAAEENADKVECVEPNTSKVTRRIRVFVWGLVLVLALLLCAEIGRAHTYFAGLHWVLGTLWLAVIVGLLGYGLTLLWISQRQAYTLKTAEAIKAEVEGYLIGHSYGQSADFVKRLQQRYEGQPQRQILAAAVETLPASANDNEIMRHLERRFVAKLDTQALEKISRAASRNGLMIALSPWPPLDMVLCFVNCVKLVKEVACLYGIAPTYAQRWQLYKRIAQNMVLAAGTESFLDAFLEEGSLATLSGFSLRAGQGVGVGIYTARLGCYVMNAVRPFPYDNCSPPRLRDLVSTLIIRLREA